jgi:hypothetical protein
MTVKVHKFDNTGDAYDACQCDDDINTGDVLVIEPEGVVGIAWVWPFALTAAHGALHTLNDGADPTTMDDGKFAAGVAEARKLMADMPVKTPGSVTLSFATVDGVRKILSYDSVEAARVAAHDWVGEAPTFGSDYAISDDGVVRVSVNGATLTDIFPRGA